MKKFAPIHVIVHYPKMEEGRNELSKRVAIVHADMVNRYIQKLNWSPEQKLKLLDSVIALAKKKKK